VKDLLLRGGFLHDAFRAVLFGPPRKTERPTYDSELPLEENIRRQLEWVTHHRVTLMTQGRDAFIFELRKPANHVARVSIQGDANAQIVMDKEKEFSDWVRREFPNDLNRFALVENSFKIVLDDPLGRDVHVEIKSNKGNLSQNLDLFSDYLPKFMSRTWLRILKPVVLVYGKKKIVHGDIKPDNILVDLTSEDDFVFRVADWGGHYDPSNPRPPYEGTPMFQTRETLLTGEPRPGDDVRALQLIFLELYAGKSLTRIAETFPDAFEWIPHNGNNIPLLNQIPHELSCKIPAPLLKIMSSRYENVLELQRELTEVNLTIEHCSGSNRT